LIIEWDRVRELFPATKKFVYLNAAEGSPVCILSAKEAKAFYDEILTKGDLPWDEWLEKREVVREKVAKLINADKSEIAFTLNTSHMLIKLFNSSITKTSSSLQEGRD